MQCRFSKSTEIVLFLHMTHPMLPKKMAQIFGNKLKTQDVASLQEMILDRCQSVLDELEGLHAAVNRMYPQQRNSNFQARAPPDRRQNQGQYQRSGGAAQRYRDHSPTKAPKHPDNYCFICRRDRNPNASNHFLRQCPQLPQRERDLMDRVFEKAMRYRNQPQDTWPEKIENQTTKRVTSA